MGIDVIIYGASGMIGKGVLLEALDQSEIRSILVIGRKSCGIQHIKLKELIVQDFMDYSLVEDQLKGYNACYFCLGISATGLSEEKYHHITYEFTVHAAEILHSINPEMTFIYVSGAGTDSTEQGKTMWARVKGKTENKLLNLGFKKAYMFRPAYIQPKKGVKSSTTSYRIMYAIFGPLYPLWKVLFPKYVSTSEQMGRAMINVVLVGSDKSVLESEDIVKLAGSGK
jgi:hypothetical protein